MTVMQNAVLAQMLFKALVRHATNKRFVPVDELAKEVGLNSRNDIREALIMLQKWTWDQGTPDITSLAIDDEGLSYLPLRGEPPLTRPTIH
jgi:hypothetical protein